MLGAYNARRPTAEQRCITGAGFSVERGSPGTDRTSVAAPVANRHGRVLGALMIDVPTPVTSDQLEGVINAAVGYAKTLTIVGRSAEVDFLAVVHRKSPPPHDHTWRDTDG